MSTQIKTFKYKTNETVQFQERVLATMIIATAWVSAAALGLVAIARTTNVFGSF